MSDIQFTEPGAWRDTSSLDFGAGSKSPNKCYTECSHCGEFTIVSERCAGMICSNCGRYYSVDESNRFSNVPEMGIKNTRFTNIHVPNTLLVNFRDGMEEKAYAYRYKQIAKQQKGELQRLHGPIDPKTGEHTK